MIVDNAGLEFIARYETADGKPNLKAIKSPEQPNRGVKYEIGFGHNSDDFYPVRADSVITIEQAYSILAHDVAEASAQVNSFMRRFNLHFNQHQFNALVSAAFNGVPVYNGSCGLSRALIRGDNEAIKSEWMRWIYMTVKGKKVKASGLVRRRTDELELYFNGDYQRDY